MTFTTFFNIAGIEIVYIIMSLTNFKQLSKLQTIFSLIFLMLAPYTQPCISSHRTRSIVSLLAFSIDLFTPTLLCFDIDNVWRHSSVFRYLYLLVLVPQHVCHIFGSDYSINLLVCTRVLVLESDHVSYFKARYFHNKSSRFAARTWPNKKFISKFEIC